MCVGEKFYKWITKSLIIHNFCEYYITGKV